MDDPMDVDLSPMEEIRREQQSIVQSRQEERVKEIIQCQEVENLNKSRRVGSPPSYTPQHIVPPSVHNKW